MTLSLMRKSAFLVGLIALSAALLSPPARADEWRENREHREHEWREHQEREREWREHEWREHHYAAPPVYVTPPPAYVVAPPPVMLSVPSGLSIVIPLRIR